MGAHPAFAGMNRKVFRKAILRLVSWVTALYFRGNPLEILQELGELMGLDHLVMSGSICASKITTVYLIFENSLF